MPFTGSDDPINTIQFYDMVVAEVNNLGGYYPQTILADEHPEILYMSPNSAPGTKYLGDSKYVLTGEFYFDTEDLQHFQLWLWDSSTGSLVYTDEMVSENYEEALEHIPSLVSWIFSQILPGENLVIIDMASDTQTTTEITMNAGDVLADKSEEENKRSIGRLYLGLRGGATFNTYSIPQGTRTYEGGLSRSFSYEAALLVEYRIMRFLTLRMEAIFSQDTFKAVESGGNETYNEFKPLIMSFPLLIKMPIEFKAFDLSIYAGLYGALPLGKIKVRTGSSNETYSYTIDPPFGVSFGVDLGFPLGPGSILFDLRYNRDLGVTNVQSINRLQYTLERMGLSLGYKFLLWKY
ncbi:MAG: PorT family protein [Spirochaetaceae bacterium]|nr:PorT family protein [Spirochaetaceae bacterium]